jgi:hypothetical protein
MVDSLRAKGAPLLQLEVGDFMETDSWKGPIINSYVLERMEAEGPAAITPGPLELSHWSAIDELLAGRSLHLVSSNVTLRRTDGYAPIAPRSLVVTVGGVRLGLLGVIGTEEFAQVQAPEGMDFALQDPREAIEELVGDLREKAEIIVVMACVNGKDAAVLAKQVRDVDVFVCGYEAIACKQPFPIGEVIFNRTGVRGQHFSTVRLIISPEGEIVEWGGTNLKLGTKVPANPQVEVAVKRVAGEASRARKMGAQAAAVRKQKDTTERYLGVETCRRCHGTQYAQWLGTPHAGAFAVLEREGKGEGAACIRCHVTGFGKASGFRSVDRDPDLRNVQCESCHGIGTAHARGSATKPITEATCLGCHTREWSPDWRYAEFLPRVEH